MTSSKMPKHKTRSTFHWITQLVNEIWPVYVILQKKNFHEKNYTKIVAWKQFQELLCLQRMKQNFYWKVKFLKQASYVRYVIAKLLRFVQISMQTYSEFFLQRILWKLKRNKLLGNFFINLVTLHKLAKFHYQTVYFRSYSIICVSCFMLRHLMTSWHFNIWKVKIWLSQKQIELSKWNKKHFSLFQECSLLDKKQTGKNVAATTFNLEIKWVRVNES